ncbi:MAG TPA: M20/M25/M40 family metallo-hydrolase [Gaiellaceae bacterium]|jgi:acetylornithine deacetylase
MRQELASLTADLVRIDSQSPDLVEGAPGEADVARFVAEWLERSGLEVEVEEAAPGRPNVIGTARGSGGGRTLMLNAHMDTVGVHGMEAPFEGRIEGDRVYGRGAYDMKAALAAIMVAGREAGRGGLRGDVVVTAVADEENASLGTTAIAAGRQADAAIVAEPTELGVAVAHRGFVAWEIETTGRAAHGSRPDLGVDAIAHMGHVLVELDALDRELRSREGHPLVRTGSLHAGMIEGGVEFSTYPSSCLLRGERRTIPGESVASTLAELETIVARVGARVPDFRAEIRAELSREPFAVPEEEPIVQLVKRHAGPTDVVGVPFWTDAALLQEAGIPTVVFGPAGEGAHANVEWVDLPSVERCAEVIQAVARDFCS